MARAADPWKLRKHATGFYYVRFSYRGKRYDKSTRCRNHGPAKRKAAEIYNEVVSGQVALPPHEALKRPLDELLGEWLAEVYDTRSKEWARTCEVYSSAYWQTRWTMLGDITNKSIRKYISQRSRSKTKKGTKLSPVSLSKELSALRRFLKWCKRMDYLQELPSWEAPEAVSDFVPVFLTKKEVMALLAELPTKDKHVRRLPCREFFIVMWATSFRTGTLARLRWDDVNLKKSTISVRASTDKKRHKRTVPLTEAAIAALKSMSPGVGLVFGMHDFRASLRSAAERAGIDKKDAARLTNHSIRHSRLTHLASNSKNIAAIQHMAGHKDLASTMRYVHGSEENARALLDEVDG